jgi:hypothetical protein
MVGPLDSRHGHLNGPCQSPARVRNTARGGTSSWSWATGVPPSSSYSVSTPPTVASSGCSPTLPWVPRHQGASPRPLLRPPRPLLRRLLPIDVHHRRTTPPMSFPPCKTPNWVPLSPSFLPGNTLPHFVTGDGRIQLASHQRGKGGSPVSFSHGPKSLYGSGPFNNQLGRVLWRQPIGIVSLRNFQLI